MRSRSGMLTLEDAWRNHAHGSKHHHFRYPSTWRRRVNPGRLGSTRGRRSGQCPCRGCGRLRAQHSLLRLTQLGVRVSACCRFSESATGRSMITANRGKPAASPAGCAARTDRVTSPSQASNSRLISSPLSLSSCSSPAVAVLRVPAVGAVSARRTWRTDARSPSGLWRAGRPATGSAPLGDSA